MSTCIPSSKQKILLVVIAVLISVITGIVSGLLTWAAEPSIPKAVLAGGGGFATSLALCLAVMSAVEWV